MDAKKAALKIKALVAAGWSFYPATQKVLRGTKLAYWEVVAAYHGNAKAGHLPEVYNAHGVRVA